MVNYARLGKNARLILRSKQGKTIGADVLRRVAGVADRMTKQQYTAKIEQARAVAEQGLRSI